VKYNRRVAVCAVFVAAVLSRTLLADTPADPYQLPSNSDVIGYLLQSVNWYRHVYSEREVANEPADLIFLDDNRAVERQIVKLSFDFAKADALLQASTTSSHRATPSSDPPPSDLAHFIDLKTRNDQLSQQTMEEIKNLNKKLNKTTGADRNKLKAEEEEAQTRLQLLGAVAQGLHDLLEFVQSPGEGQAQSGHLESTINDLEQSIPEVKGD
jgi:hypothetical protein